MPPRWLDHFSDRLMPGNPKRRIRPVQTWIAILITLPGHRAMQFVAWTGSLPGLSLFHGIEQRGSETEVIPA